MKDKFKGIIIGIIIGVMLVPTVYATVATITKEIYYNDILITLNGDEVKPTDANGEYVEPFIMDGTTYLPVRGIANALGMDVEWDDDTKTVKLTDGTEEKYIKANVGDVVFEQGSAKVTLVEREENGDGKIRYNLKAENAPNEYTLHIAMEGIYDENLVRMTGPEYDAVLKSSSDTEFSIYFEKIQPSTTQEVWDEEVKIGLKCLFFDRYNNLVDFGEVEFALD